MDWSRWGKGKKRHSEIFEAPLTGRLRALASVSWHNGARSELESVMVELCVCDVQRNEMTEKVMSPKHQAALSSHRVTKQGLALYFVSSLLSE